MTVGPTEDRSATSSSSLHLSPTGIAWTRLVALHATGRRRRHASVAPQFGFGLSEFLALAACAAADDGEMRMQDLTEAVYLNQSSVSRWSVDLSAPGLPNAGYANSIDAASTPALPSHGLDVLRQVVPVYEKPCVMHSPARARPRTCRVGPRNPLLPATCEVLTSQVPATHGHQPRSRHSATCGRSAPRVVSLPWPGLDQVPHPGVG